MGSARRSALRIRSSIVEHQLSKAAKVDKEGDVLNRIRRLEAVTGALRGGASCRLRDPWRHGGVAWGRGADTVSPRLVRGMSLDPRSNPSRSRLERAVSRG